MHSCMGETIGLRGYRCESYRQGERGGGEENSGSLEFINLGHYIRE